MKTNNLQNKQTFSVPAKTYKVFNQSLIPLGTVQAQSDTEAMKAAKAVFPVAYPILEEKLSHEEWERRRAYEVRMYREGLR